MIFLKAVAQIVIVIFLVSCKENSKPEISNLNKNETTESLIAATEEKSPAVNTKYLSKIIYNDSIGYGYDIFANDKMYIHQPHIPGISGNRGFKNGEDAQKVSELMIEKLNNNIIPPTITIEELNQLNIK
jgi:hypothetical protein